MNLPEYSGDTRAFRELQKTLAAQVDLAPLTRQPRLIGGADVSFDRGSPEGFAAIVVLELPSLKVVARSGARGLLTVPYIPGYLSFRELPLLEQAWRGLEVKPEVVMVDGHGVLHPRGLGIASHFGVALGVPSFGCAKRKLVGEHEPVPLAAGSEVPVRLHGETRGTALRSRARANPLYISPGHALSLADALTLTRACLTGHKLPAPTRAAHLTVNALRRGELLS